MKKILFILSTVLAINVAGTVSASARSYTSETLNYQIVYHWGLVWKHAADAKLSISKSGNGYYGQLTARTRSIAETFYPVRDTLKCWMNANFTPKRYEKLTHEKSYYARDIVDFTQSGNTTTGKGVRIRKDKPKAEINLSTQGKAYDMLSVFYMLRDLKFNTMSKNTAYTTTIFSGKQKETLTIQYHGKENIKLRDDSRHTAHHITFKFTQDGRKKSSDPISAWLSDDADQKPLMLKGSLPVGEVRVYLAK